MKKLLSNLILFCCAILFCFVTGEIIVRVFYARFSNYDLEMWRYASELKQPLPYKKLPFHHFPNKGGHYYGVDIKTNSLGFRDDEYDIKKPLNKKRIIFLGDSFTLGWGVPIENTFSKQLERMLNEKNVSAGFEIINMGTGNYNSIMEVELFKRKGLKLSPDLIVLMYFVNDAEPTPQASSTLGYIIKRRSYLSAFLIPRYTKFRLQFDKNLHWREYYSQLYLENSKSLYANRESIKELITLCKEKKIKLLIVNIPELRALKEYPFPFATEYIKTLAEQSNVSFLDLLPAFSGYSGSSLWVSREDFHTNAKANLIIAEQIYKELLNEKLALLP